MAYESILYARRCDLHRRVAEGIEMVNANRLEEHFAVLAQLPISALMVQLHRLQAIVQERCAEYEHTLHWLQKGMQWATVDIQIEYTRCYLVGSGIYQRLGRYTHSIEWSQRGLEIMETFGTTGDMAYAYYILGGTYSKLGCTQESMTAIEKSLSLCANSVDMNGQANAHTNLANVLADAGRWQEAIEHGQAAMEIKESIGDVYGQAILANNLGDLKRHMGDYEHAKHYFHIALEQFTLLGSDYGTAVLHMNLGAVSLNLGLLTEARSHLEQSKLLFEQTGTEEFLAELYRTYAELAQAEQSFDEALEWANQSLSLAQRLQARSDEGATRSVRSHILKALGKQQEALDELRLACAILEEVDNRSAMEHCLQELAHMTDNPDESAKA